MNVFNPAKLESMLANLPNGYFIEIDGELEETAKAQIRVVQAVGGDPLFDRAVLIHHNSGDHLAEIIQDEGVQSAIMELVFSGGVILDNTRVYANRMSDDYPMFAELAVPLVLLAVHLGCVLALFLNFAWGKFTHGFFRLIALVADEHQKTQ